MSLIKTSYYVPDQLKSSGSYKTITKSIKKIDIIKLEIINLK